MRNQLRRYGISCLICCLYICFNGQKASAAEQQQDYVRVQKFKLQYNQIDDALTDDPNGVLYRLVGGDTCRLKRKSVDKGNVEGYLKWISSDPNGFEMDIEFAKSQYTHESVRPEMFPENEKREYLDRWLKPFTAHVVMQKKEKLPLSIEITKTAAPENIKPFLCRRTLDLLGDLLLTATKEMFVLEMNNAGAQQEYKQVYILAYPEKVIFQGKIKNPVDYFESEWISHSTPRELHYHFAIQGVRIKNMILSYFNYLNGTLLTYEYEYDLEKKAVTRCSKGKFSLLADLKKMSCNELVELLNTDKPVGVRTYQEVWVEDVSK